MSAGRSYQGVAQFAMNAVNTFVSILKIVFAAGKRSQIEPSDAPACVVLGNGPSLTASIDKHLSYFKRIPCICVNSFAVSHFYEQIKPSVYVMIDPGIWEGNGELMLQAIESIKKKTSWPMVVYLPRTAAKFPLVKSLAENNNIRVRYVSYTVFKGFRSIQYYFFRKNFAMPQSQNVLVASVFIALNAGFKKLYVVGADHSWHEQIVVNKDNVVCLKQIHFHDDEKQLTAVPFVKAPHVSETFRMDEAFHAWAKVFDGHRRMNLYAEYLGSRIYNASEYSYVDAYERKQIDEV